MTEVPDLLTEEVAGRLKKLLSDLGCIVGDPNEFAVMARSLRIGMVDPDRHRAWIDETVYAGTLYRLNHWRTLAEGLSPLPMLLFCPHCGEQHVDQPEPDRGWTNPPHRSHLCASCGHIWRPADICTVGVAAIATRGRLDADPPGRADAARAALAKAAGFFREYEKSHRGKAYSATGHLVDPGYAAKAATNRERAEMCEAALASHHLIKTEPTP